MIGAVAKACGSDVEPFFREMYQPLMKYANSERPPSDRAMVVGTLAEIAEEIGESITNYLESCLSFVVSCLADEDEYVRRNGAYCTGVLCKASPQAMLPLYQNLIAAISPLFTYKVFFSLSLKN